MKHLIYGHDPNEAWCPFGRFDDNVDDIEQVTCESCPGRLISFGDAAHARLRTIESAKEPK